MLTKYLVNQWGFEFRRKRDGPASESEPVMKKPECTKIDCKNFCALWLLHDRFPLTSGAITFTSNFNTPLVNQIFLSTYCSESFASSRLLQVSDSFHQKASFNLSLVQLQAGNKVHVYLIECSVFCPSALFSNAASKIEFILYPKLQNFLN